MQCHPLFCLKLGSQSPFKTVKKHSIARNTVCTLLHVLCTEQSTVLFYEMSLVRILQNAILFHATPKICGPIGEFSGELLQQNQFKKLMTTFSAVIGQMFFICRQQDKGVPNDFTKELSKLA